jgi:hypothetical protein
VTAQPSWFTPSRVCWWCIRTRGGQNKASITANATQHELIQEAAERQRAEDKAGKQLERVQSQNAEFVYPVGTLILQAAFAFDSATYNCGLEAHVSMYGARDITSGV